MSATTDALTTATALGALATAVASWRTARETRSVVEESRRAERLRSLQRVHELVGHVTEVGWSEKATRATKIGISLGGGPRGMWYTIGVDIRSNVAASGADLPLCREVAEFLMRGEMRGAPIRAALEEVEQRILALADVGKVPAIV